MGRAGPCGPQEDLGFCPKGGGPLEGCEQKGRGLSQVLTGALWRLLRGGQTGKGGWEQGGD